MKPNSKTVPYITAITFFLSYFLFTFFYIDPRLVFIFNGINKYSFIFEFSRAYAAGIAFVPGGFAKLVATLIVEACEHGWLGAVLLSLVAGGLTLGTAAFVTNLRQRPLFVLHYAPAILFMVMLSRYSMHYLPAVLSVLGSITIAVVYQRVSDESAIKRCAFFSLFLIVAYYLFSFTAVLFGVLAIIHDYFVRKDKIVPILCTAAVLAVVLFLFRLFIFPFDRIFNYGLIVDFRRPLLYLFLAVPLSALLAGLSLFSSNGLKNPAVPRDAESSIPMERKHTNNRSLTPKHHDYNCIQHFRSSRDSEPARNALAVGFNTGKKKSGRGRVAMILCAARDIVVLLALAATMLWATRDWTTITLRELGSVLYGDRNCLWNDILQKKHSFLFRNSPNWQSPTTLLTTHALYRALYHTGRLGTDLFSFPQIADPEPLLLWKSSSSNYLPAWAASLESAMDLGALNFAEKTAGEAMENMGPLPFLLFRRALIQAAKGNDECAQVYLKKLEQMPGYGLLARRLRHGANTADLSADTTVVRLRFCMDTADYIFNRVDEETVLSNLLKSNPKNRMAFEYLMAYYLLCRQPDMVARNLYRLDDFGYSKIPVLYEEALEIFRGEDTAAHIAMPELAPSPVTAARSERFLQLMRLYETGAPGSQAALVAEFGASYFFFFIFRHSAGDHS